MTVMLQMPACLALEDNNPNLRSTAKMRMAIENKLAIQMLLRGTSRRVLIPPHHMICRRCLHYCFAFFTFLQFFHVAFFFILVSTNSIDAWSLSWPGMRPHQYNLDDDCTLIVRDEGHIEFSAS